MGSNPAIPTILVNRPGAREAPVTPGMHSRDLFLSESSSAWLERLVRDEEVAGSNPVFPTREYVSGRLPVLETGRRGFESHLSDSW